MAEGAGAPLSGGTDLGFSIREFVGHLSPEKREIIAAPARFIPPKWRYGKSFTKTEQEIATSRSDPAWSQQEINRRLTQTLTMAGNSPYYSREENFRSLSAEEISTEPREAIKKLPIITRSDVTQNFREMLVVDESQVEMSGTSGTSGQPVLFFLDRNRGAREWAFIVDAWSATGYKLGDWRAFFRGIDLPHNRTHFAMPSIGELVIRIQSIEPDTIDFFWKKITERKIRYLHGYASALLFVARVLEDAPGDTSWRHEIRGIFPASEQFTRSQEEILRRVFPNAQIAVFYGMSEKIVCAWMDGDHVYHSYPTYGYVELLNPDGSHVEPGERGRVISTSMDGRGQPLLRYDTGDSAEFVRVDANGSVVFKDILSRRGREGIVRSDGELFATTPFLVHGDEFSCVYRFRIRQEVPGKAVLVVQPSRTATREELDNFYRIMVRRTQNQVDLDLELVDELPATVNGKSTLLDQRIPDAPSTWA